MAGPTQDQSTVILAQSYDYWRGLTTKRLAFSNEAILKVAFKVPPREVPAFEIETRSGNVEIRQKGPKLLLRPIAKESDGLKGALTEGVMSLPKKLRGDFSCGVPIVVLRPTFQGHKHRQVAGKRESLL